MARTKVPTLVPETSSRRLRCLLLKVVEALLTNRAAEHQVHVMDSCLAAIMVTAKHAAAAMHKLFCRWVVIRDQYNPSITLSTCAWAARKIQFDPFRLRRRHILGRLVFASESFRGSMITGGWIHGYLVRLRRLDRNSDYKLYT